MSQGEGRVAGAHQHFSRGGDLATFKIGSTALGKFFTTATGTGFIGGVGFHRVLYSKNEQFAKADWLTQPSFSLLHLQLLALRCEHFNP